MPTIPRFGTDGLLPPGDYEVTFDELRASILASGPNDGRASWDSAWRLRLIDNLETLSRQLWQAGVREIFADGSFAEDKDHPNDIDGYFECSLDAIRTGEMTRGLNRIDPFKVWTWDPTTRRPYRGYPKKQLPMWHRYRVGSGLGSGIRGKSATSWSFLRPSGNRAAMANRKAS